MKDGGVLYEGRPTKDRSHYGVLVRDEVLIVTPEQAATWLNNRPPPPIMWTRGAANNEKSRRFAALMRDGKWNNDLPVEPVMVSEDHGCVLGGHHRLTAVSMLDHPQELRVLFWSKPKGWETVRKQQPKWEPAVCPECNWWAQTDAHVAAHMARAHTGG